MGKDGFANGHGKHNKGKGVDDLIKFEKEAARRAIIFISSLSFTVHVLGQALLLIANLEGLGGDCNWTQTRSLQNVFDFDNEDEIRNILVETMNKNGIPTGMEFSFKVELAAESTLPGPILIEKWRNGRVEIIRGSQKDMNVRGTWRLDIPAKWDVLEQKNGRAAKFSEWLYSFKLFPSGSPSDLIMGADQHLYAISTSPVNLIIVSPEHRKQKTIHLYEFIPASRVTRLSLAEIGVGKIAIHNSQEHSIITLDLQNSTISPILLAQLDHVYDSYLADGSIDGFNGILSFSTNFSRLSAKDWGNSFC